MKELKDEPYWHFDKVTIDQQRLIYKMSKELGIKMPKPKNKGDAALVINGLIVRLQTLRRENGYV